MTCDCCDSTSSSPDPVVVRLEAEVERWKLNVADAQGRIRELYDENARLRGLLRECDALLIGHHKAGLIWEGECPICSYKHTQDYPHNVFGRIEAALEGKP